MCQRADQQRYSTREQQDTQVMIWMENPTLRKTNLMGYILYMEGSDDTNKTAKTGCFDMWLSWCYLLCRPVD